MSERGVFAVDRGIWSDPDFPPEPFTEREAFLWLVGEAAWRPSRVRVGSALVEVDRGQCAFSTRFMAAKWQWSEARVRRFLTRLQKRGMTTSKTDAHATQITICKYDAFQRVSLPSDAPSTQERRKVEDKEYREDSKEGSEATPLHPAGATKPTRAKSERGTKVDPAFWPNEHGLAVAAEEGIIGTPALRREVGNFIDHHTQKGTLGKDWQAGWRTWCRSPYRKPEQRGAVPMNGHGPPAKPRSNADINAEIAMEADRELREKRDDIDSPFAGDVVPFTARVSEPGTGHPGAPLFERLGADRGSLSPESPSRFRRAYGG